MAVYERAFRRYAGELTPARWRFLVLARFALQEVFRSRLLTAFYALAGIVAPLIALVLIYLRHNLGALAFLEVDLGDMFPIDERFFFVFLNVQSGFAFVLTAFVGPALVSPDLAHNALPLYLARPFSRAEYVLGKLAVLAALLSAITWVPGLLLFLLQAFLEGAGWGVANLQIAWGLLLGAWVWILGNSLLALALSAWVRWRPVAGALYFGATLVSAGFANAVAGVFDTRWGHLVNLDLLYKTVWSELFGVPQGFLNEQVMGSLPVWAAWASLAAFCGLCLLMLARKVRAYEVVR
jgi:ABC-2 type transport system permease protein